MKIEGFNTYSHYTANSDQDLGFNIFEFVDNGGLVPNPKEKNKYFCPVCEGHNLGVDPKTGAYHCFNSDCDPKDIREALKPWEEKLKEIKDSNYQPSNRKRVNKKPKPIPPCPIPEGGVNLALLPDIPSDIPQLINESIPNFVVEKCGVPAKAKVKSYQYSETQLVKRYQWDDDSKPKGYSKTIRPWYLKNGAAALAPRDQLKMGKGTQEWEPYRLNEAVANGKDKWVIGVEGEDGVEDTRSLGLAAVTWQGAAWREVDLGTGLSLLKNGGIKGLIFISDNDETGEKKAKTLLEVSGKVNFPVVIIPASKLWDKCPEKGDISDWIQWGKNNNMTSQDLIKKLEEQIQDSVNQRSLNREIKKREDFKEYIKNEIEDISFHYNTPQWGEEYLSDYLFKEYENELLFEADSKEWYAYSIEFQGIWSELKDSFLKQKLRYRLKTIKHNIQNRNDELSKLKEEINQEKSLDNKEKQQLINRLPYRKYKEITVGFIDKLAKHISYLLLVKEMQRNHKDGLIPFKNGVLELETKKLLPYAPEYLFTWQLPYDYNPLAQCDPIKQWLIETLGDPSLVELIRAYFYGILTGRTDWQKYLELIGTGGAGKGTITRLAIALVGFSNCHVTSLRDLETNRFEPANLRNKRLAVISEADDYVGSFNILKALLGQDPLRRELKNRQATTFIPECLVMIASNENIRTKDNTSGLARRRITIGFNKAVPAHKRRDLISFNRDNQPQGDFADYIPGLLNWVLTIDPDQATALIKDSDRQCAGLAKQKIETLIATNSLAAWLQDSIVTDPNSQTFIGRGLKSKDELEVFLEADSKLYPNYCRFVEGSGLKAVSLNRFRENLLDLCIHQLKLEGISDGKDRRYGKFIQGLRLRVDSDTSPPLLDQIFLERDNRDDLRQPEIESETAETYTEKAVTAIEGKNQLSENLSESQEKQVSSPTIESDLSQGEIEEKNNSQVIETKKPSQPSQPSLKRSQPSQEVVSRDDEPSQDDETLNFQDIINETNQLIKALGWSLDMAKQYLIEKYGKRSRQVLSDEELIEFLQTLRDKVNGVRK